MPNGYNCALNHGAQLNSYSGCIQKELLSKCANDMLALYRMHIMAIKSVHLP